MSQEAVPTCSDACPVCGLVPLHLPAAKARVQPRTSLHFVDPHHPVGCAAQHDSLHAPLLPEPVWLAGLHHTGDLHLSVPHLASYWYPKWPAQDALDLLPTELPPAELCCIYSWYVILSVGFLCLLHASMSVTASCHVLRNHAMTYMHAVA